LAGGANIFPRTIQEIKILFSKSDWRKGSEEFWEELRYIGGAIIRFALEGARVDLLLLSTTSHGFKGRTPSSGARRLRGKIK